MEERKCLWCQSYLKRKAKYCSKQCNQKYLYSQKKGDYSNTEKRKQALKRTGLPKIEKFVNKIKSQNWMAKESDILTLIDLYSSVKPVDNYNDDGTEDYYNKLFFDLCLWLKSELDTKKVYKYELPEYIDEAKRKRREYDKMRFAEIKRIAAEKGISTYMAKKYLTKKNND
jgi:hypothetical protein